MNKTIREFLWLLAPLTLMLFMPGNDSVWIDEGQTLKYARLGSVAEFFSQLTADTNSEAQMPLGIFAPWLAAKFIGLSALAHRWLNMAWLLAALGIFWKIGRTLRMPWLPLLFAVQPYVWFYANEIRPYTMQIFGGAVLAAVTVSVATADGRGEKSCRWLLAFWAGALFLCLTSMLGVVTVSATFLTLTVWLWLAKKWRPSVAQIGCVLGCWASLGALGVYYLWTLFNGAGGAKLWHPGVGNILFSLYELAGYAGLGPDRQLLRDTARQGLGALVPLLVTHAAGLLSLSAAWFALLIGGGRRVFSGGQNLRLTLAVSGVIFTLTLLLMFAAARCASFPFWGRHLAPAFAFWVIISAALFKIWLVARPKTAGIFLTLTMALLLFSSLMLRFAAAHRHDDYRAAAVWARAALANGETVWWSADLPTAEYYQVPAQPADAHGVVPALGHVPSLSALPDVVITSKSDIYDAGGEMADYLARHHFILAAEAKSFKLWRRP